MKRRQRQKEDDQYEQRKTEPIKSQVCSLAWDNFCRFVDGVGAPFVEMVGDG
jgi:hypothetical protein